MKKIIVLLLTAVLLSAALYAGPKEDVINSLKITELTRILDLNEEQIASLIFMEKRIREIHEDNFGIREQFISELEKKIEKGDFTDAEKLCEKAETIEQSDMEQMHELRLEFLKKLNNEQKLKFILFEFRFRDMIKEHFINKGPGKDMR